VRKWLACISRDAGEMLYHEVSISICSFCDQFASTLSVSLAKPAKNCRPHLMPDQYAFQKFAKLPEGDYDRYLGRRSGAQLVGNPVFMEMVPVLSTICSDTERIWNRSGKDRSTSPFQRSWQTVQDRHTLGSRSKYLRIPRRLPKWLGGAQIGHELKISEHLTPLEAIMMMEILCGTKASEYVVPVSDSGEVMLVKPHRILNFRL
jgi:hypothetical protein